MRPHQPESINRSFVVEWLEQAANNLEVTRSNLRGSTNMVAPLLFADAGSRFRAKRGKLGMFKGLFPESQGQHLAVTVFHVPYSLDSGSYLRFIDFCITQL